VSKAGQRSSEGGGKTPLQQGSAKPAARAQRGGPAAALPGAGNHAIGQLLQAAAGESGVPLDRPVRDPVEKKLGVNLGNARVHSGTHAAAAAESVDARAYTGGTDVSLGAEASGLSEEARRTLLTHEAIHTVQQGGASVSLTGSMAVSHPGDPAEREARTIAAALRRWRCGMRWRLREWLRTFNATSKATTTKKRRCRRDGLSVDFTKSDATKKGQFATEDGTVSYTPSDLAPESDHIKFIQMARARETGTGNDVDYTGTVLENLGKMRTTGDTKKNIAPGFMIDHAPKTAEPVPVQVNCAERMPVCHAICCKLDFALTASEVESGAIRWELGRPYQIRHEADGFCTHRDRDTGFCGIYDSRPGIYRSYSCAHDKRIWKDFERMELNREWLDANLSGARAPKMMGAILYQITPAEGAQS
jgi:hypothetical protein